MSLQLPKTSPGYGWPLVTLLAAVHGFAFYDRLLVAFLAPVMKKALTLSDTQLGIVLGSGFALVFSAASLAMMIRRLDVGQRGVLAIAIAGWSIATAACGLATSFAGLVAARMLMGLAQAALSPLALPMIAGAVPRARLGRAVAVYTSASTLGRSAAMLGGAIVLSFVAVPLAGHDGWRLLFTLSALPNVVLVLLVARIPAPPGERTAEPLARHQAVPSPDGLRAWAGANRTWLVSLGTATTAVVLVIQTATAWATSLLVRRFGLTVAEAGTLFGLIILAAAPIGQGLGGLLVDRVPTRHARRAPAVLMAGALVVALPIAAALAVASSLAAAGAALAGLTFILGVATPLGPYGIQLACPPPLRGRATAALLGLVTAVGFGLGPATLGILNDRVFGPGGTGKALLCVCATAAVVGLAAAVSTTRDVDR